jgi:Na+/melibiose symporter-like transporter
MKKQLKSGEPKQSNMILAAVGIIVLSVIITPVIASMPHPHDSAGFLFSISGYGLVAGMIYFAWVLFALKIKID